MKLVEAIISSDSFAEVRSALEQIGVDEITESQVSGHSGRNVEIMSCPGAEYAVSFIRKIKVEVVAADDLVGKVVQTIRNIAGCQHREDCRVFILAPVDVFQLSSMLSFKFLQETLSRN